ncbi:hypothetical protein CYMTET_18844 [Cymbomonas tetramitiformis]|uniref:PPPDE domain-containing protein n=1 Tax=Cymbomonas tetramitiformis TaxID=36881 RepID=A0AAE0L5S6_9CHLO|nr:hypothetical protein CYMTET_18844 [Cymbomonas tetramitiformis]
MADPVEAEVRVNVYDLWENNQYSSYCCGMGIFHSGVEVYDSEYAYGAHDYSTSGIFETLPRKTPGTVGFKESVVIGTTHLSREEVDAVCDQLGEAYRGNQYHLLMRNCNHFTDSLVQELTGNSAPGYVNRIAWVALWLKCLLPAGLNPPPPPPIKTTSAEFSEEDDPLLRADEEFEVHTKPNEPLLKGGPQPDIFCPVPHPTMERSHIS